MQALYHPLCKPPKTCNYSLSAIDYNNYIDNYDSRKSYRLIPKITFSFTILVENAMPIHMAKTAALYPIII